VRITPRRKAAEAAASAAAASAAQAASAAHAAEEAAAKAEPVEITLPPGTQSDAVKEAVKEARRAIRESIEQARREARDAAREAADAAREAAEEVRAEAEAEAEAVARDGGHTRVVVEPHERVRIVEYGDFLPNLALLWILASAIIKITYKRQIQAEAQAAQAVETAEAEALKRQVVEARMAAMQAQVEPHFLFNTLASIDHLIEVDPKRASQMQKNLIALLRASMPTMRETADGGVRDLGRELAVIRPYLEILKVRMEERLETHIDVPEGLVSAEFPPMMVQTLVENAIKHGLEPKPEGGKLTLKAEIVHGKLAVTVSDTGLGFGRAATAGTGVGLANIRERLQLLYGPKAGLTIAENEGGGTRATITVPYRPIEGVHA
jgi:LytS/YehU family sensor histidine kinase